MSEKKPQHSFFARTLVVLVILLAIDVPVITNIFAPSWQDMIYRIQKAPLAVRYVPAAFVYILLALCIVIYVLPRLGDDPTFSASVRHAGILGLLTYGVFDFTNLALLRNYSTSTAIVDTLWGGLLLTLASYISAACLRRLPALAL